MLRLAGTYTVLTLGAVVAILPFLYTISVSLMNLTEANGGAWLPRTPQWNNYLDAWNQGNFSNYFWNSVRIAAITVAGELLFCTLAAYAFARYEFCGKNLMFSLVLIQLMIMPEILIVRNYQTLTKLGLVDTLFGIGLPYFASAFAIFLLRQTFRTIPKELVEAAEMEGATALQVLRHVYIPLAKPTYLAFALVSVSYHWNNFLWPLVVSNSVGSRPLTVGLQVFSSTDQGIDWSVITAATLLTSGPLLIGFLIFQRQFVQSFMRAGIK